MRIGTMFLGEVESVDNECIKTKFFVLGVPLFPIESFYATTDTGDGITGLSIEVHPVSVAAGYLRIGTGLGAFLAGLFAWMEWRSYDPQWTIAAIAAMCAVAWVPSMFLLGRLSAAEVTRRRRLRLVAGVGAPPELLSTFTREELATAMVSRYTAATGHQDWRQRLTSGEASSAEMALLWAIAEYHQDRPLAAFGEAFFEAEQASPMFRMSA